MPNWCENSVTLTHSDTTKVCELENVLRTCSIECDQFEGQQKQTKFFEHYLPRPRDVSYNDVCDWNEKAWGTKWEPQIIGFKKQNQNTIDISMDTAWTPPIGLYKQFVENGWVVEALYHEPGYAFCGQFTNELGDVCYDYDKDDIASLKKIPNELLEFTCIMDDINNDSDNSNDSNDSDDGIDYKLYKKERKQSYSCLNKVVLTQKEIRFIDELEDRLHSAVLQHEYEIFNLLLPRPEDFDDDNNDNEAVKLILEWNFEGWGTHCEPEIISFKRVDTNIIEFVFHTSFTPPINLYQFLVEEEWTVNALYYEQNAQICGCFTNDKGNMQYDTSNKSEIPNDVLTFSGLL
jgi:hypothetical protein